MLAETARDQTATAISDPLSQSSSTAVDLTSSPPPPSISHARISWPPSLPYLLPRAGHLYAGQPLVVLYGCAAPVPNLSVALLLAPASAPPPPAAFRRLPPPAELGGRRAPPPIPRDWLHGQKAARIPRAFRTDSADSGCPPRTWQRWRRGPGTHARAHSLSNK